nr:hypothetical protein [Lactiplantibacillus plantarum]
MKKLIPLKKINSLAIGLITIIGFVALGGFHINFLLRFIIPSMLALWVTVILVAQWYNTTVLKSEINDLKGDVTQLGDSNQNKSLKDNLALSDQNRQGLIRQVKQNKLEFDKYNDQIKNLEEQNDKLSRESLSIIVNMLGESPNTDFLYQQVEKILTSSIKDEVLTQPFLMTQLTPFIEIKEKLLEREK